MSTPAVKMQRSQMAARLAEFETRTDAEVRQDLVAKFRFLIDTGRYHVSAADIAQAMMDDGVMSDDFVVEDERPH
jgi:anti-sigma28 factor (negative regulator of flagellin synthesis)